MTEEKEEKLHSNDWIEVFQAINKMHPFAIAFTIALSLFFVALVERTILLKRLFHGLCQDVRESASVCYNQRHLQTSIEFQG